MRIGGLTPLTSIDYPGELAAVLFCQGCPWRCGYCHNTHLLSRTSADPIGWDSVLAFLERRRGLLDAVVFSGGEPTLQRQLPTAVHQIRELGFKVGLHTAGPYPRRLSTLLPALDWVALDIKAPRALYDLVTGVPGSGARAWESARRLIGSGIDYEIRTTVHPNLLPMPAIEQLVGELRALGATHYRLQRYLPGRSLNPVLDETNLPTELPNTLGDTFADFAVRA